MKNKRLLHLMGNLNETYIAEAKPKGRAAGLLWQRWGAVAAAIVLFIGTVTGGYYIFQNRRNIEIPRPEKVSYMDYNGPILPLTARENPDGITAEREVAYDFFTGNAAVTDRYILKNTKEVDQTISLLYPVGASLNETAAVLPQITVDGEMVETTLHVGAATNLKKTGATGEKIGWNAYQTLLADGSYQAKAFEAYPQLQQKIVVYEIFNVVCHGQGKNPTLNMEFQMDYNKTTVMTYRFNGGKNDVNRGLYSRSFSLTNEESHYLVVLGEDLEEYTLQGYKDGGCNKGEEIEITATVNRSESTLGEFLQTVRADADLYVLDDQRCVKHFLSKEQQDGLVAQQLQEGILVQEGTAKFNFDILEDVISNTYNVQRVVYAAFDVTIPAGEQLTVESSFLKDAHGNYVVSGGTKPGKAYDVATQLGSNLVFDSQSVSVSGMEQMEIKGQNFGFDLKNGVTRVTLNNEEAYYWMELQQEAVATIAPTGEPKETPSMGPTPTPTLTPTETLTEGPTPTATFVPITPIYKPTATPTPTPVPKVYYQYTSIGTIKDWFSEGDLIYTIFEKLNKYVVFDSNTGEMVKDVKLNARPGRMRVINGELWISYPDLKCIRVYDKSTFTEKRTISLDYVVEAFDVYGDYLFYAEEDQHVRAFRYNMTTKEQVQIIAGHGTTFTDPCILVEPVKKWVYITAGSDCYCYDLETLEIISMSEPFCTDYDDRSSKAFLLNGKFYWSEYRLDGNDISKQEHQYHIVYFISSMLYVDNEYIITTSGIFNTVTGEQLFEVDHGSTLDAATLTKSKNVMFVEDDVVYIIPANPKVPTPTPTPTPKPTPTPARYTTYTHTTTGVIVDWVTEQDKIHTVFKDENKYILWNTNTGTAVKKVSLNTAPGEIHIFQNELWISYPALNHIKVYDKDTFTHKKTITVGHSISAFDVLDNYIFYSGAGRSPKAYRYDMGTGETAELKPSDFGKFEFYEADVLVDPVTKLVYIGESGISSSVVVCYDARTLEGKYMFEKDGYGFHNATPRMFLLDGGLYWGEFRLKASNLSVLERTYYFKSRGFVGMLYVDDYYVITNNGVYLNDTGERIYPLEIIEDDKMFSITASGNVMKVDDGVVYVYKKEK